MLSQRSKHFLKYNFRSRHTLIILCGLLIGFCYIPVWLAMLIHMTFRGSSSPILNLGFLYLGSQTLWLQFKHFKQQQAHDDERFIGYALIVGSAVLYFMSFDSLSLQSLAWMLILLGSAYSSWGFLFIRKYWISILLVLISFYPDYVFLATSVWRFVTPEKVLEYSMAQVGEFVLQLIGQPASANGTIIELSAGAVDVGFGCSGFDMSLILAGTGVIASLFFKLNPIKSIGLVASGIAIALILNVPRIVLLTFAAVYWGEESFEFWHGPWGGQIFATVLFTIYYYAIMAFVDSQSSRSKSTPSA